MRVHSISKSTFISSPLRQLPSTARRMFATAAYRADQPKTLAFQKTLPRLPIPALQPSFDRYIKSLRPLLLQDALKEGKNEGVIDADIKKREEWVSDFMKPSGLGRVLQERLKGLSFFFLLWDQVGNNPPHLTDVDRVSPSNWLDDGFWLKAAYHSWRVPLPVNSNWWILMADDLAIPDAVRTSTPPKGKQCTH